MEASLFFPKILGPSREGLLKRLAPLVPVPVLGGGPAGVVEFAKKFVLGLLVGVVVLCGPEDVAFEPRLPNIPPVLVPPAAPPKILDVCPDSVFAGSAGLFGVLNPMKLLAGAVELGV